VAERNRVWGDIATFLVLATVLSGLFEYIIVVDGRVGSGQGMYVFAVMWAPGIAALLACRMRRIPFAELGLHWPTRRWVLAGWLLPLGYALVAYAVVWAIGYGSFGNPAFIDGMSKEFAVDGLPEPLAIAWYVVLAGTFGVLKSCANALGEEIGWRGFLVPRLVRVLSPLGAVLVSGVVWTTYHVAVLVGADYNSGTPVWWGLSCFAVMAMSMSVVMAWLRMRSGSVWPAVILHGSHNLFVQGVFTPLTGDTGDTRWVIDEFGIGLAVVSLLLAVWVITTGRLARACEDARSA
jgi:uncharacterized protein